MWWSAWALFCFCISVCELLGNLLSFFHLAFSFNCLGQPVGNSVNLVCVKYLNMGFILKMQSCSYRNYEHLEHKPVWVERHAFTKVTKLNNFNLKLWLQKREYVYIVAHVYLDYIRKCFGGKLNCPTVYFCSDPSISKCLKSG